MLEIIITSSVLIAVLILLLYFFKGNINLRLQYALWLLMAVSLLIPFSVFGSPFSVLNIAPINSQTERIESPAVLTLPESSNLTDGSMNEEITDTENYSGPFRYFVQNDSTGTNTTSHEKALLKDILHHIWPIGAAAAGLWFILQNIWFYTRLRKTRETVKYIIAHEETHYRHGDHLWPCLRCLCLVVILVMSVVAGCTFTGTNENSGKDVTLYERAGVTIAIPNEYADQLLIDPVEYNDDTTLIRIYQKSTYEKYEGMGFLFSIARYTEAQYEQFLSSDGSGQSFFAKDKTSYYGFFFATDVQAPDDYEEFFQLFSAVGDYVKNDMITRNGLTAYSDDEFFSKTFTYDSEHIFLSYYPYYAYNGSKEEVWTLILSNPATQGDTGVWCVERWKDQHGNIYPYFPDENGMSSREYYAARQAEADSGSDTSWLDPKQVALAFVKRVFNHSPATLDSFEVSDSPAAPSDSFDASTGNIHDYMTDLLAGKAVSDYDLLPCLENFTHTTWAELDKAYGDGWWNPLWLALRNAAVSSGRSPHDYDEQSLRDYYIGKAILASDGAYTEGLTDILALQWDYDRALYSACLIERFSVEEAAILRRFIIYSLSYNGGIFGLHIPETGRALYLNVYPIDFPFSFDLAEQSRESYRAESFGQVTVVESDGLQVTYLNPAEGVYTVITIRAVKEGYSATGVSIGDTEEALLEHWRDKSLKKLSRISYDDEVWFGKYDLAYAYTPEESTKSVVFLIKDGMVSGIELINGLDGALY